MIRLARKSELDAYIEIIRLTFEKISIDKNIERSFGKIIPLKWWERKGLDIKRDFNANPKGFFVKEFDGKIAGFIATHIEKESRTGKISHLAIHPNFQRKGFGSELMDYALSFMRTNGMKICRIEATDTNDAAIKLYKKIGFKPVSVQIHLTKPL